MFLEATADLSTSVAWRPALKMTVLFGDGGVLRFRGYWGGVVAGGAAAGGGAALVGGAVVAEGGGVVPVGGGSGGAVGLAGGLRTNPLRIEGEAFLRKFGLEKLVFWAGEKIGRRIQRSWR